jgi:hypothetical protein
MSEYIYQISNALPDKLCDDIICMFELEQNMLRDGVTLGGIVKPVKDTKDMLIPKDDKNWERIEAILKTELSIGLKKYIDSLKKEEYCFPNNSGVNHHIIEDDTLHIDYFMIQRYQKGKGKYVYHCDYHNDVKQSRYRVITYIFYLNDVVDGGETEFWGGTLKIKPAKGKLVLFPATWTYPHRGVMPISDNKYIITSWFYIKSDTE